MTSVLDQLSEVLAGPQEGVVEPSPTVESVLPRVGAVLGDVTITKIERRTDTHDKHYWIVGFDSGGKTSQTKQVRECGPDSYEVAWRAGRVWKRTRTDAANLIEELAKPISGAKNGEQRSP